MIRMLDFTFSIIGLIIFSPFIVIMSVFICIESKGSAFYFQERIGMNGIPFKLFKFRSMKINSDKSGLLTIGMNDSRITKLGSILRKYKIDEIPQLWNVLKGEMSVVGPRPEVKKYTDLYTASQRKVLTVRPGMTDLASIVFSNENELLENQKNPEQYYILNILPRKIELNLKFIDNPNMFNYFNIILKTVFKILK